MFSKDDSYIIVNYHYVRNPDSRSSGIFPCPVDEFERQIKFLSGHYKILSVGEVWESAKARREGNFCALTFDDGLKDHYLNVFPVLKKYGVIGTFFIIGSVFDGVLPSVFVLHTLISFFSVPALVEFFEDFLKEQHPLAKNEYSIPPSTRLTSKRMHEDIITANFKETMMRIPPEMKAEFIEIMLARIGKETKDIRAGLFMNEEEIKELQKGGMHIGSHSYVHAPLYGRPRAEIERDLGRAGAVLSSRFGALSPVFSYPHGRANDTAIHVLQQEGVRYAVTVERRGVRGEDSPFLIPRYDTADLVGNV